MFSSNTPPLRPRLTASEWYLFVVAALGIAWVIGLDAAYLLGVFSIWGYFVFLLAKAMWRSHREQLYGKVFRLGTLGGGLLFASAFFLLHLSVLQAIDAAQAWLVHQIPLPDLHTGGPSFWAMLVVGVVLGVGHVSVLWLEGRRNRTADKEGG